MAEFTKEEQVQAIYDLKVGYTLGHADIAMLKAMARQLLASMEQEPYGYVHKEVYESEGSCGLSSDHEAHRDSRSHIPLYAAPQLPQPAVPDAISTRQAISKMEECEPCDSINVAYKYGWNACRSAMLQGAEPVSQHCTLPTLGSEIVNEAAWKLFNMLTEHGPLNGHQFNNLKGCFHEALRVAMSNTAAPQHDGK